MDDELPAAAIPVREHPLPFQRHHALAGGPVLAFDDHRGPSGDRGDVPVVEGREEQVVPPLLVHEGRAGLLRGEAVHHRRQLLEVQLDRLREVLRLRPGLGDADRHALAREQDLPAGEGREVGRLVGGKRGVGADRPHVRHVRRGEHPVLEPLRLPDPPQPRVRQRASDEGGLPQAGHEEIADEPCFAEEVARVFLALDPRPDSRGHARSRHPEASAQARRGARRAGRRGRPGAALQS